MTPHLNKITAGDSFGRPPIRLLDVGIQIRNIDPPDAPATDLDPTQIPRPQHGPDERFTHIQLLSNLLDSKEARRRERFVSMGALPGTSAL